MSIHMYMSEYISVAVSIYTCIHVCVETLRLNVAEHSGPIAVDTMQWFLWSCQRVQQSTPALHSLLDGYVYTYVYIYMCTCTYIHICICLSILCVYRQIYLPMYISISSGIRA